MSKFLDDLVEFISFLGDRVVKLKTSDRQDGRYKKAYIYHRNPKKKRREPCK